MSRFVADLLQHLFPDESDEARTRNTSKPYLVESLVRGRNFNEAYKEWHVVSKPTLFSIIHQAIIASFNGSASGLVSAHHFQGASGLIIDVSFMDEQSAEFLHETLKTHLQQGGYLLQHADRQYFDRPLSVERHDRYYLKPAPEFDAPQMNQHFGNVLLELVVEDRIPRMLKVQATYFSDRQYLPPRSFESLAGYLFNEDQTGKKDN
jgi:hypothetical protein